MRRWFSIALLVLAIILGSLLGVLNAEPVAIDLLFVSIQIPLGLALTLALALGLLLGSGVLWLFRVVPLNHRVRRLQRDHQRQRNNHNQTENHVDAGNPSSNQALPSPGSDNAAA